MFPSSLLFLHLDLKLRLSDLPGGAGLAKQNEPTMKKFHKHIKKLATKKIQKNIQIQMQHPKSMKVSFSHHSLQPTNSITRANSENS